MSRAGVQGRRNAQVRALRRGLLSAAVVLGSASPAFGKPVGVAPVEYEGELNEAWRQQLRAAVHEGLHRAGARTVAAARPRCLRPRCVAEVAAQVDAGFVLRVAVEVSERDYRFVLQMHDASEGVLLHETAADCTLCGIREAEAELQTKALALGLKVQSAGDPRLAVRSRPAGATVLIDGRIVGRTPTRIDIEPGPHDVTVRKTGYAETTRRIRAVAGSDDNVLIDLDRAQSPTRRRLVVAGAVLASLGVGSLAGGFPLLALHGRPVKRRCTGTDIDSDGNCRFLHDTRVAGASLTAVGLAFVVVGTALLLAGERQRRRRTQARAGFRR